MNRKEFHEGILTLVKRNRTSLTLSPLVAAMLPEGRGNAQAYIRTSIVSFHQSMFSHMRLTLGEMVEDITQKYQVTQTNVLTVAIIWHTGKQSAAQKI